MNAVTTQPFGMAPFPGSAPGDTPVNGVTLRPLTMTPDDGEFAATLLVEAFRGKFAHNVTEEKLPIAVKHMSAYYRNQHPPFYARTFVAELEGEKVGIIHLKFHDSSAVDVSDHISEFGCWHGCRYGCMGCCLDENVSRGKCYVDHICVLDTARGRGVGRLLMQRAEYEARKRQCRMMFLSVLTTNRAIHLYEREGYQITSTVSCCGCLHCIIGPPGKIYVMEKILR